MGRRRDRPYGLSACQSITATECFECGDRSRTSCRITSILATTYLLAFLKVFTENTCISFDPFSNRVSENSCSPVPVPGSSLAPSLQWLVKTPPIPYSPNYPQMFATERVQVVLPNGRHIARVTSREAEVMVSRGEAEIRGRRVVLVVRMRSHSEPAEVMGPIVNHGPRAHKADSSTGDAGRGWARAGHTLHIAIGMQAAGHWRSGKV